jgi:peptidoglycan hydrolase FlgJ
MDIQAKISRVATNQVGGKTDDIKDKAAEAEKQKLKKACADFESLFVYNLLKTMRQSVPKGGLLGNGPGKDIYEMMFDQQIAKSVASKPGGIGLQQMLQTQMSRYEKPSGFASGVEKK